MNRIKFSHKYSKMPGYETMLAIKSRLVQVIKINYKDLTEDFIKYDTRFQTGTGFDYYPLPKGELLILMIRTGNYIWTTVRRWTPQKEEYYRSKQGEDFLIEIKDVSNNGGN